jgi:hypothetical protein
MKHRRFQGIENAPWITPEGLLDPATFPIEVPIRQCLDPKSERFRDDWDLWPDLEDEIR